MINDPVAYFVNDFFFFKFCCSEIISKFKYFPFIFLYEYFLLFTYVILSWHENTDFFVAL